MDDAERYLDVKFHEYDIPLNDIDKRFDENHELVKKATEGQLIYYDFVSQARKAYFLPLWAFMIWLIIDTSLSSQLQTFTIIVRLVLISIIFLISLLGMRKLRNENIKQIHVERVALQVVDKGRNINYPIHWSEVDGIYKMGATSEKHREKKYAVIPVRQHANRVAYINQGGYVNTLEIDMTEVDEFYEICLYFWKQHRKAGEYRKPHRRELPTHVPHPIPYAKIIANKSVYTSHAHYLATRILKDFSFILYILLYLAFQAIGSLS